MIVQSSPIQLTSAIQDYVAAIFSQTKSANNPVGYFMLRYFYFALPECVPTSHCAVDFDFVLTA